MVLARVHQALIRWKLWPWTLTHKVGTSKRKMKKTKTCCRLFVTLYRLFGTVGSAGPATLSVVQANYGFPNAGGTGPLPPAVASGGQTQPGASNTTPPVYREPEYEASPLMSPMTIELYENERYSPRLGFCAKGLIIGDRGNFSNGDGSWR